MPLSPTLDFAIIRSGLNLPMSGSRLTLLRYALPLFLVSTALGLTFLSGMSEPANFIIYPLLFLAAVAISAWFGGTGPGWMSVVLSTLAVNYFLIEPVSALHLNQKGILWSLAFAVCAIVTHTVSLLRRRVENVLRQRGDELDARVRERTAELERVNESLRLEIAERLRAEDAKRESRHELARASRVMTMGVFTASLAHEINQPLAAVVTNGNALLNWLQQTPPNLDEAKASVSAMVAAAERASKVTGEIRCLIEKRSPTLAHVDLNAVVNEVLSLVQQEIKTRNVNLKVELRRTLPIVWGNPVQLQQVVLNMIMNGIEAMDGVSDRPRDLQVRTDYHDAANVTVTVEDSGHGLAGCDVSQLFEPFYSTKSNGIGVGLSLCRSIAEAHGGRMRALARVPYGAAFSIVLPIATSDP